ncbi:NEQ009 [Nanoarchaeum equitans Kin4-M]|uniref:NEQ009 n=1 Tax=Nanoarchaeum equitans (strain Kin4-M) TaxID=228908 RepID=Q74MF5_NANEQ|nr:NEQ009 [Nanoarchaeum equitans Kin4-M]
MKEIEQVIEEFNRLHKANCKLLEIKDDTIIVLFSGHICFTCGTYDYFEDLAVLLSEKLNKQYGVEKYEQLNGDYIVYYKPKEKIKQTKRDIKVIFFQI